MTKVTAGMAILLYDFTADKKNTFRNNFISCKDKVI